MHREYTPVAASGVLMGSAKPARHRTAHRVPCRLRVLDDSGIRPTLGETVNVSDSGLAVQLGADISPGSRVEVLVAHLAGEPTCFYGEVVRRRRVFSGTFEIGIAFHQPVVANCS